MALQKRSPHPSNLTTSNLSLNRFDFNFKLNDKIRIENYKLCIVNEADPREEYSCEIL